jgi:cytosolic carboxypeptidase protein 2/3
MDIPLRRMCSCTETIRRGCKTNLKRECSLSNINQPNLMIYRIYGENTEMFSYDDCNFEVQKSRESTARVVMWREFNLINSFTLEASFCGPTRGPLKGCHFNPQALEECGRFFCKSLADYVEKDSGSHNI